ncbi:MAG: translocation/assembly module TamB domain-containing protein, partial [Candidatus Sericytochromatia bacterium]
LSIDPTSGEIAVDGLAVTLPGKPDEKFLAAEQVIVDVDMTALLTGRIRLERIHLYRPEATIIHRGDDRYNFEEVMPETEPQQEESKPFLGLDRITIDEGHVTYLDAPREVDAEITGIKSSLTVDLQEEAYAGEVAFDGWARYQDFKQPIESFRTAFRFANQNLTLRELALTAGETVLALRGSASRLGEPGAPLSLDGELRTQLRQWAPLAEVPLGGAARADFTVRGTADAPLVAATVTGEAIRAREVRVETLETRLVASKDRLEVKDLVARLFGGRLQAEGVVPLAEAAALDVRLAATGLDLALIKRQLELAEVGPMTGSVSARVEARGPELTPEAITATGWVETDGTFPVAEAALPVAGRTDFRWERGLLALRDMDFRALGGSLKGRAQVTPLAEVPGYGLEATVRGIQLAALQPLSPEPIPATGTIEGEISVSGSGFETPQLAGSASVRLQGALAAEAAGNPEPLPLAARTRLAFEGQRVRVNELTAQALGGDLSAQGTITLGPKPLVALEATARSIDLAALNRTFGLTDRPLSGQAGARLSYVGDRLTIQAVEANTLGGTLSAAGTVDLAGAEPRYALDVVARAIDLAEADRVFDLLEAPLTGSANASFAVTGTGDRFSASGPIRVIGATEVASPAGGTQRLPIDLSGEVALTPSLVRLSPLTARIGESTLTARGQVDMAGSSDLRFSGSVVDAPAIASLLGLEAIEGGKMTLEGQASGPANNMRFTVRARLEETAVGESLSLGGARLDLEGRLAERLTVTGRFDGTDVTVGDQRFASLGSPIAYEAPRARPGAGVLRLPEAVAQLDGGRLAGTLRLDLASERYTVRLASEGLRLRDIEALRATEGVPLETPVRVTVTGEGTLQAPAIEARVALDPFTFQGQPFEASELEARLEDGKLRLEGQLFARQFDIDGEIATDPQAPSTVTITFDRAQLGPVMDLLPPEVQTDVELPVEGLLTGRVALTGPLGDVARLKADVRLTTFRLAYRDFLLENEGPIRLSYGDSRVAVERLHLQGPETDLRVRGIVGLGVASNLSADGQLNMVLLEKLQPKSFADASGVAVIEAQLRGTLGQPDMTAALIIRDADLQTRNLPQSIHELNATIRLVNRRIFLDNMAANLGYTGRVQAFGGATLGEDLLPTNVSLQLSANEIEVRVPEIRGLINADLSFSGTPDASRLDGSIRLLEGRVTKDVDLAGQLLDRTPAAGGTTDLSEIPFVRNMALRVAIQAPGQLFIENNVAEAELRGDLMLLGTVQQPNVVGRAETITGVITFQDRLYVLREASVDFIDPHRLEPYIHVLAEAQLQGYDILAQVNGTPEQFKLDLSSVPFLPQSDILTLLATGQTPAQLAAGGGEGLAVAGNLLLNQVTRGVERGVADQGVVDVLRIQPGSVDPTEPQGGSFTVGKRLSERLMVTYTQDISVTPGQTPGRLVIFDYSLTDEVVLKLEQNLGGGFNASARY